MSLVSRVLLGIWCHTYAQHEGERQDQTDATLFAAEVRDAVIGSAKPCMTEIHIQF